MGRPCLICQPSSRTVENPPYGMIGGWWKRRHHSKPGPRHCPTRLRGAISDGRPYRDQVTISAFLEGITNQDVGGDQTNNERTRLIGSTCRGFVGPREDGKQVIE